MDSSQAPLTKDGGQRHIAWMLAVLFVLVALFAGNWQLITGRAAPQWDGVDFFGPGFGLVADHAKAGQLLLWNPWTGAGAPDWAEPEFGTTSPVVLFFALLSPNPQAGYVSFWLSIWTFGALGMLVLAKHLGATAWGCAIVACGFAASGFYTGHAEHTSSIYSISFVPWIIWRMDVGLRESDWWCGVQAGALYGISALGGYPFFTIVTPGFLLLWVVGRIWFHDRQNTAASPVPIRSACLLLAITVGLGAIIFSPPHYGTVTATKGYSDRVGPRPREESVSSNLLEAGAFSTLASPYLAVLNSSLAPLWPRTDISMTSVYTGAAPLLLAIFGLKRGSRWRWWLLAMALFFGCCALGSQLPLRGWLYDYVPPTRYFRNPALFRFYVIFLLCALAASASADLQVPTRSGGRRLFPIAWLLALAAFGCFFLVNRIAAKPLAPLATAHVLAVWSGLVVLTALLRMSRLSATRFLQLAAVLALFDAVGALYVSLPIMYTPATLGWWHEENARHQGSIDLKSAGLSRSLQAPESVATYPNNRNVALKVSTFDSYLVFSNRFQKKMLADPVLNRIAVGSQRIWFSAGATRLPLEDSAFELYTRRVHDLDGEPVLILHSPAQMLALAPAIAPGQTPTMPDSLAHAQACIAADVTLVSYQPNSLSLRYRAPSDGYLLVTDRWADGWQATINGKPTPVLGGNFIFRAISVGIGDNLIQFEYRPRGYWSLLAVSWGTLLLISAVQCWRFVRAR